MFTKKFAKDLLERAIKSAAQGAVAVWGIASIADLQGTISTAQAAGFGALSMGVLSVLTSLASGPFGDEGTASLVKTGEHQA